MAVEILTMDDPYEDDDSEYNPYTGEFDAEDDQWDEEQ